MSVPRYQQIAAQLRAQILDGTYQVGDRLPTLLQLQRDLGVPGINTVRSALKVLADDGLVRTDHGNGTFVTATATAGANHADLLTALHQARTTVDRAIAYLERQAPTDTPTTSPVPGPADHPGAVASTPSDIATSDQPGASAALQALRRLAEHVGATPPEPDTWPEPVLSTLTRRNRTILLTISTDDTGQEQVRVTFLRRPRGRGEFIADSEASYTAAHITQAASEIHKYLRP
ncbi:GntR family transcriptional regulator [Rudaeicoccus suwonensis]|uniref:Regulatory GntR family protein n=1 Tax=Rudaeicoccus suwonensis TaxID=657409 RepID=A0A561E4J3_9MICO|nr:winged helix-turn-helix domain-containing protein [Rudaeicoccus suwonensis]TWE10501.1 regulatory GntR family protein [Rudaeicoccus suwonensis]